MTLAIQKLLDDTLYGVRILYVDPDSAPVAPVVVAAPAAAPLTAREAQFEAARPQHIAFPKVPPVRATMQTLAMDIAPPQTAQKPRGIVRRVAAGIALAGLIAAGVFVVRNEAQLAPTMARVVTPVLEQTQTTVSDLESDQLPWNTSAAGLAPGAAAVSRAGGSVGRGERLVRVDGFESEAVAVSAPPPLAVAGAAPVAASPATLSAAPAAAPTASSVTIVQAGSAAKPAERRVAHVSMTPLTPPVAPAQQANAKHGNPRPAKPPSDLARELLADL